MSAHALDLAREKARELRRLRAELDEALRLLRAAVEHIDHDAGCPAYQWLAADCKCGVDDARERIDALLEKAK